MRHLGTLGALRVRCVVTRHGRIGEEEQRVAMTVCRWAEGRRQCQKDQDQDQDQEQEQDAAAPAEAPAVEPRLVQRCHGIDTCRCRSCALTPDYQPRQPTAVSFTCILGLFCFHVWILGLF